MNQCDGPSMDRIEASVDRTINQWFRPFWTGVPLGFSIVYVHQHNRRLCGIKTQTTAYGIVFSALNACLGNQIVLTSRLYGTYPPEFH